MIFDKEFPPRKLGAIVEPDEITGVILFGGKSSRMGRDKAMLPLYGTILFDKVLDTSIR